MKQTILSYWKPAAAITFWGASFIATKIVLDETIPLVIIELRLFLAVILLALIALWGKRDFSISIKNHSGILILALIACFHLWIQVTGMQFTTASNTGWIIGVTPVFMAFLGFMFFKERVTSLKLSGIVIAFAGLLLLISNGDPSSIDLLSNKGDFLVLGSAFTWAVYSAMNKKISLSYPPLMTILYLFIIMLIILLPFVISSGRVTDVFELSLKSWISILFLGFMCSGIAYVLWAQSLKEMDSTRVGAFLYFEPFVTVFTAWIILSEEITLLMMISGIVITAGVILVNITPRAFRNLLRRE